MKTDPHEDKRNSLVQRLCSLTQQGKCSWAFENEEMDAVYSHYFSVSGCLVILRQVDTVHDQPVAHFSLINQFGQVIDETASSDNQLCELFRRARSVVCKTADAYEEILEELEQPSMAF